MKNNFCQYNLEFFFFITVSWYSRTRHLNLYFHVYVGSKYFTSCPQYLVFYRCLPGLYLFRLFWHQPFPSLIPFSFFSSSLSFHVSFFFSPSFFFVCSFDLYLSLSFSSFCDHCYQRCHFHLSIHCHSYSVVHVLISFSLFFSHLAVFLNFFWQFFETLVHLLNSCYQTRCQVFVFYFSSRSCPSLHWEFYNHLLRI